MSFVRVAALIATLVVGCAPSASAPTPTASAAPPTVTATASPTAPPRIQAAETPFVAVAGPFVVFQMPGETRLRAIPFGGEANGRLEGGGAGQTSGSAGWLQSPYGAPYLVGNFVFGRDGHPVGPVAWPSKVTPTWSAKGTSLCAAVPERDVTGSALRLEILTLGQPARLVATGFATFSDNAVYRVLACDESTDRAVVASFGQGVTASKLWVFRISTGAVVRSVDYAGVNGWVAASADGSMLAETVRAGGAGGPWKATIRATDDGAQLGTVDGYVVQGFSGDKTLIVGANETSVAVIEWKTGRKVWTASGPYGGFLAEPAGRRFAVGIGFVGGSDQRDVYLVAPDGSAPLLPDRVRVALLY